MNQQFEGLADRHIIVDDAYHTSVRTCFAAGDIVPGPQLAIAANKIFVSYRRQDSADVTGRIYDRDVVTLGPALDRLGNAWVRRTSR